MMEQQPHPPFFYMDVQIYCPKKDKIVKLCIETEDKLSPIVKGKPFSCNKQAVCSKGSLCLLDIPRIEVRKD
jgi:hypothetical protein